MSLRVPTMLVAATTVLAMAGLLAAQPASAQGTSTLSGQVCEATQVYYIMAPEGGAGGDRACGYALPGATVTVKPTGALASVPGTARTATTDDQGMYKVTGLADGEYTVEAARAGFATASATLKVASDTKREWLLEGANVTVSGAVRDEAGAPIADAIVTICCEGGSEARTGPDGAFRATAKGGHRDVSVHASGFIDDSRHLLLDGAGRVEFSLKAAPAKDASLSGTVTGPDGKPVAGARVDAYSHGRPAEPEPRPMDSAEPASMTKPAYYGGHDWTVTDRDGRYRIAAHGGQELSVQVSMEGYVPLHRNVPLAEGEDAQLDLQLKKYPAKDARLVGKAIDAATGKPVPLVSVYAQNRPYGTSEWSDCGGYGGVAMDAPAGSSRPMPQESECAIRVNADGSFEALLMPGVTSITVSHQPWRDCPDGTCEQAYYDWVGMVDLEARAQTELVVRLVPRPQPDATVQGYVLDAESGKPIPGATLWFSNQDGYGYGSATTDSDGSYSILLRQGYHRFGVAAPGHHAWDGVAAVRAGTTDLDIRVKAGEDAHSGCCGGPMPMAAEDRMAVAPASAASGGSAAGSPGMAPPAANEGSGQGAAYKDLGGKLGPYDAGKRAHAGSGGAPLEESRGSPATAALLLGALVLGMAALRRRRA